MLGEEEVAQGKVKIKEMGLRDGHPEKEGVLVNMEDLVSEVKERIRRKDELEGMISQADGLRVVGGIRGEAQELADAQASAPAKDAANEEAAEGKAALRVETIGAVPAS